MKIKLLFLIVLMSANFAMSQSKTFWQRQAVANNTKVKASKQHLPRTQLYALDINGLKQALSNVPDRSSLSGTSSGVTLSFPNDAGKMERFQVVEASNFSPDLQDRYPEIRAYVGKGIDDPSAVIRFSVSPLGFQSMRLSANQPASFIEALTTDLTQYAVFKRADKINYSDDFECEVTQKLNTSMDFGDGNAMRNADDGILRTYRLAVSATGEYTQYHGGTKALALSAINATMTRVNGIYESDFNVTMVLIANTDDVIYTSTNSDPYGNTTSGYNSALQSTLSSVIGESNYDIGHLFANLQNNGNAGCIGCVCVNNQKGSGWTSHTVPEGDPFDVDYVAHEMGHQFGGNHTWTFNGNEGTNAQMEPGSGSTIMGYAGITGATDVQSNSDPYFHAISIQQITDYIKTTSCQTNTNTGNAVPTVNAGANYTIPRGTAFVLEGTASDADAGDVLTYCWEQFDENNASTTNPSVNATSGVAFRSYTPTTDNKRYFPRLATIKTGATSWQWEAVPNVARNLNFRLTVRDNQIGGGTNNSDDMVVTVNGTAGPFVVNSPNTNVTWNAGTAQTVTWDVAGTTGNGVNAANVDIFLSIDGGDTYPITLASGVPNDGSHDIIVPNNQGNQNRIMVRGSNNIFFDISNTNFTIAGQVVCNANVPTGLNASNVGATTATLSWDAVPGATYDLRYRVVGATTWTTTAVTGISSNISGLSTLTQYETQVRSKCSGGTNSAYSAAINFTTTDVQLNYCNSASTNVNDEFISRVQLNTIDNSSGAQFYSDFTGISTVLTKEAQYTITVTPTWTGTVYNEAYAVWIDYNRDGDFNDAGEQIWTQSPTQATPVSGSFTIPTGAVENSTTMRVSMKYNAIPTACETFTYGEVEDYTVIIEGSGPDTVAPVITLNGASTINLNVGDTYTELGATATDDVDGDISADIVIGGDVVNTNIAGTYAVTYNVSDAAGNAAAEVVRTVNVIPDTTAPVITLNGAATINLNLGDTYTELGATATDNIDGDISADIVIGGDVVNTSIAGTYAVTYNVSDAAGNAAVEVVRTVNVIPDTTAPVITLNGAATINLNLGDTYTELGAMATDNIDGDISADIIIGGDTVNTNIAGTYLVTYNVSDAAGNAATEVVRTVNVNTDTQSPTAPTNLTASNTTQTTTDLNWNPATDNIGVVSYSIFQDGGFIANISGTSYVVTGLSPSTNYAFFVVALDAAGNTSPSSNIANVTTQDPPDTQAPTAPTNLIASNTTESTTDLTWNASSDNVGVTGYEVYQDGSIIATVATTTYQVTGLTPSTSYNFYIIAKDAAGNSSAQSNTANITTLDTQVTYCNSASTNVNDEYISRVQLQTIDNSSGAQFYSDFTSISTTLTKGTQYTISVTPTWTGTVYNEAYSVWIDYNKDGDFNDAGEQVWTQSPTQATPVSGNFTIPTGAVESATRMRVSMKYNAIPTSCETFTYGEVEDYTVVIEGAGPDTTAPVITLNGASTINLDLGTTYTELGATATDNVDGDISANIIIGGDTVDTNAPGTYLVTYNVSDAAGNAAVEVVRTVNVIPDTTAPVITLNGASTINLTLNDVYTELGATAIDNVDGDISSQIVIGGDAVDTNIIGTYVVTYNVSDASGNAATEVVRTIIVSEVASGCAGGISTFPYSEGFENTLGAWTQSNADDIDWTVDANGTPSSNTGPSSASQGSYYVYVEASSPNFPSKRAILNSPCFDLSALSQALFTFKYHMYGAADMGTIDLEVSEDDGATWSSIWSQTGNKGNTWLTANVDLTAYVGTSIKLRFNRFVGGTWQADIAIDDVGLTEGGVTGGNGCSGGITSYPYSEGFENTLGAWTQSTADDLDWTIDANGTPSSGTGPSSAVQGTYYLYVEASGNNVGYPNKRAIITSPCFDLTGQTSANFSFSYHQYGATDMGTLDLEVSNDNGASWITVWNSSGNLGNSWQSQNIDLSVYTGESIQLRFNRFVGSTWQADIAIDNINLSTGTAKDITSKSETAIQGINIYPNPVKGDLLNIRSNRTDLKYEIYNSLGQLVARGIVKNKVIDISGLDGAVYQIRFNAEGETFTKRFIKQ